MASQTIAAGLVDVAHRINANRIPFQLQRGDVHADGAVARRTGEDRHAATIRRRQERLPDSARLLLALGQILADEVVKLRRAEGLLERIASQQGAIKLIGAEQIFVVEDNVVDANHLVLPQFQVGQARPGLIQIHAEGHHSAYRDTDSLPLR